MRNLFKIKKQSKPNNGYYLRIQNQWVKKMQHLTNGLSKKKLLCLWAAFVFFSSAMAVTFIYKGFSASILHGIAVEFVATPVALHPKARDTVFNSFLISKRKNENTQDLSPCINNLKVSIEKGIYDNSKEGVPRLCDSLHWMENYMSNLKK